MCVRKNCVNCIICEEFMEVCAYVIIVFQTLYACSQVNLPPQWWCLLM